MSWASKANEPENDTFIAARPTPILACGLYGPIRNTVDVAVMDVEQFPEVGKIVGASAALADPILRELVVHPVGQLVAVRKLHVPEHLIPRHQAPPTQSKILAEPWPSALQYLNGSGFGDVNLGITALAVSPNGRFIAVCERHRSPLKNASSGRPVQRTSFLRNASSHVEIDYPTSRIRIYYSSTGMKLATLECCTEGADWTSIAFSSDSMQLVTACDSDSGLIAMWRWYSPSIEKQVSLEDSANFETPVNASSPLIGRATVPLGVHINRARYQPNDLGTIVTSSGEQHLSFWTLKVDDSKEGTLEQRCLLSEEDLHQGDLFTDHAWLVLKEKGCEPCKLLVAITSRDKTDHSSVYCFNQDGNSICALEESKVALRIPLSGQCTESICVIPGKGFVIVGSGGLVALVSVHSKLDSTPGDPQIHPEISLSALIHLDMGSEGLFCSCPSDSANLCRWFSCVSYLPLSDKLLLYTKDNQLLTYPLQQLCESSCSHLQELFANGPHFGPVIGMDAARDKPLVATIARDGAIRIWNLLRGSCEICCKCNSIGDEPVAVAFHPAGNLLAVGFRDRLRIFNVLHKPASLVFSHDWQLKGIRVLAFDGEGKSLAVAVGINVMIFDPFLRLQKGLTLTGHIKPVSVLRWAPSGGRIWSTGTDGNVFGWDLTHSIEPGKRMDDLQLLNRSGVNAAYLALVVRTDDHNEAIGEPKVDNASLFTSMKAVSKLKGGSMKLRGVFSEDKSMGESDDLSVTSLDKSIGKHSVLSIAVGEWSYAVVAGIEGGLREVKWDRGLPDSHVVREIDGPVFTSLELDDSGGLLYAGSITGSLFVFKWPLTETAAHMEFPAHTGGPRPLATQCLEGTERSPERIRSTQSSVAMAPVFNIDYSAALSTIRLIRHGRVVLTCGGDGSFICHAAALVRFDDRLGEEVVIRPATTVMPLNAAEEAEEYNTDIILVTTEYLNDLRNMEMDMVKTVQDLTSDLDFSLHQLNTDSADKLKKANISAKKEQSDAEERYKKLEAEVEAMKKLHSEVGQATLDTQVDAMSNMECMYEQQLGESMARFDKMSLSVVNVKANASRVLEERDVLIKKELRRRSRRDGRRAKLLQAHADKLGEEYRHGNRFHRMSLMQQESEYESEVAKLMAAMTKELKEQRLQTISFKSKAQLANTKAKQLSKRLQDMQSSIDNTQQKSGHILELNTVLEGQILELEEQVASKQEELDECEGEEKKQTSEHQRLETFRTVLKAKANDMEAERAPLEEAVKRLEEAKKEANDVLLAEFASKAKASEKLEEMAELESNLTKDVKEVHAQSARLEQRIESFKRELCSLVEGNLLEPDLLRQGAISLAKKYLFESSHLHASEVERKLAEATASFGEVRIKEEMVDVVRERNLMQAELRASASAMTRVEASAKRASVVRVAENTFMIDECNRLRRENLQAKRDCSGLEALVASINDSKRKAESSSHSVESLPSTVISPGYPQTSLNDVSLSATTCQPMDNMPIQEEVEISTAPSPPMKRNARKATTLPIIMPPNAPAPAIKGSKKKVPKTLRGSVSALAALEVEGDELVYQLQRSRMTIAAQQAELEELRRSAHGMQTTPSNQVPPSSTWLDDKTEDTKTMRSYGLGAAEEASVLSFTSTLSNGVARKENTNPY